MFGSKERREQMRKREGREREDNRNNEEREILGENEIKILLLFLQYCYSAILTVAILFLELHCNKYCKKFTIFAFSILGCNIF